MLPVQRFRIETGYYASRYRRGREARERIDAFAAGHIDGPADQSFSAALGLLAEASLPAQTGPNRLEFAGRW